MFLLFCFWLLTAISSYSFFISEIFANPLGKAKTFGYQWFELYNNSEKRILVKNIHIAISVGKNNDIIFNEKIDLIDKIPFDDYLLVAQDKSLGFYKPLKVPVIAIENKQFLIPVNKKFSICVSINKSPFSCVHLTTKDKFDDGTSLYFINNEEENETNWFKETCEWQENIKATPGLKAQVCNEDPDFTKEIFDDFLKKSNVNIFLINDNNKSTPIIKDLIKNDKYELSFSDEDKTDVWFIKYCKYNSTIKNLCEEINPNIFEKSYFKEIFLIEIPFYIKIRDLFGLENKVIQK